MLKYVGEVCFSTVGEPKLCHLFARSRGFIEYSYKIKKKGGGGGEKSKHFLAACGTASEDCPIFRFWPKAAAFSFNLTTVDPDVAGTIKTWSHLTNMDIKQYSLLAIS